MLEVLSHGDAIGNEAIAIASYLRSRQCDTCIFCISMRGSFPEDFAKLIDEYKDDDQTVILFHLSAGGRLNEKLFQYRAKVIIRYHNITPPEFFHEYDRAAEFSCLRGRLQAERLRSRAEIVIADSSFNKEDLRAMGYTCPVEVLPIIIQFNDYETAPDQRIIDEYSADTKKNIIFTGRIAPNKKHEDLIRAFYYYHLSDPDSRLLLIGGYDQGGSYYKKLIAYRDALGLKGDVIFTGHIPFNQILSYYRIADLFLCLSEHEGFCVPLVEAMWFHVPIIAYDSTAVGDTLGGAGLLLDGKEPELTAASIDRMLKDKELRDYFVQKGIRRLRDFDNAILEERLGKLLNI